MPTLFEDWLRASAYKGAPSNQQSAPANWDYAGTPARAVTTEQEPASIFHRLMGLLNIPAQGITGAIKGYEDAEQERESGRGDWTDFLRPLAGAAGGVKNAVDYSFTGTANPMVTPQDLYLQYSSMKDRPTQDMSLDELHKFTTEVRGPEYEEQLKHMSGWQKALRATGNTAALFGTDPLTYVGGEALTPFKAGLKALGPGAKVDEALAGANKTLGVEPNVPEGLSPGQAAAAIDPASIKLNANPTVPIDSTGPSLINNINPFSSGKVADVGSLTDRTLPGVPLASDTVEAAGRAAPEPLMEPAETAPGFIDDFAEVPPGAPLEELASKVEANPNLPAGAAALADKVVPHPQEIEAAKKAFAAEAAKREKLGPDVYDAATAEAENKAAAIAHENAVDSASSAENLKVWDEAQARFAKQSEPTITRATNEAHEDALQGYQHDLDNGMSPEEAWAANGPEIAFHEHVAENLDSVTDRMAAARKSAGNPAFVSPEDVAARFANAEGPVAEKMEQATAVEAANREAIPAADSVEEAESKVGTDPSSIYQALKAGASKALPRETSRTQRVIEESLAEVGKPLSEGGRLSEPSQLDIVANMAADKIGASYAGGAADSVLVTIEGEKYTLDLGKMARELLSKGEYGRRLVAQMKKSEVTDRITDVLFEQPKISDAAKVGEKNIDPMLAFHWRGGEVVDPAAKSTAQYAKATELGNKAAKLTKAASDLNAKIKGPLRDAEMAAQEMLSRVVQYEEAIEMWETRLAAARRAKKSTAAAKAGIDKVNKFYAKKYGSLTREEAVAALKAAGANIIADEKELAKIQQAADKAEKIANDAFDKVGTMYRKELDKISDNPAGASYSLDFVPDTLKMVVGTSKKRAPITFADVKEAIISSAKEYNSVMNLTRQYERGESIVPGVKPRKPANVTPDVGDAAPPVTATPYQNVRNPVVQAENNVVLRDLAETDVPIHSAVTGERMTTKLFNLMSGLFRKVDQDINTPWLRYGNESRYAPLSADLLRRIAKEHGKPQDTYLNLYKGAGEGQAGIKMLQENGIPDIVVGSFTIEKQINLARGLKNIFHFNGSNERNSIASRIGSPTKAVKDEPRGMTPDGIEERSRVTWESLVASEVSYEERGAKFISNYYPKDPQRLSDVIRVAAQDTTRRLKRDIPPHLFMTPMTGKVKSVLNDPELVEAVEAFWESTPFISRNFDGVQDALKAKQWGKLKEMFPSIAEAQRYGANELGIPTKNYGMNARVKEWSIDAEPGAAYAIQRAMSQTNPNRAEALANEAHVAARAQETVQDAHKALDDAYGGDGNGIDDGGALLPEYGFGPDPATGSWNSNSGFFNMLKQLWKNEMGHNEILNLIRDRNSYAKYVNTEAQNWWDVSFKGFTKKEISTTIGKMRHEGSTTAYTEREQTIRDNFNEWLDHNFRGPDSVFKNSGLTEAEFMEYMPNGPGNIEFRQLMDPEGYIPPSKVRGEAAIHLFEDAPQVMSNMQNALTRALAMKHYRGDVMARWTSPVATGKRTAAIKLNGKTVYMVPEYAAQMKKSEAMFKEMLQYTPNGNKLIKEIDGLQGIWKTSVTIARPGHHVRNSLGNSFMLLGGLTHSAHAGTYLKDAMGMMRDYGNYGAMIKSDKFASDAVSRAEFKELLATGKVAPRSKNLEPKTLFSVRGEDITDQMVMGKIKEKGLFQGAEVSEDTERLASNAGGLNKKFMHAPGVRRMRQISSLQEHSFRGAMFRGELEAYMRKGMTFDQAADKAATKARRFYPDGLTLTTFEKNYLRRIIPFYTYNRTIMGPLLEVAMTKPQFINAPFKAQQGIGQVWGGGENDGLYPDYLGKAYPMGPTYTIGDAQIGVDIGSQHLDAYKLLSDPGEQVASMITPFGAVPYSLMTGADPNGTPLRNGSDKMNYLANQVPVFNSLFPAFTGNRVGADAGDEYAKQLAWINFLTGTKQKQLNTPKNEKAWEFQQRDKAKE